MKFSTRSRYGLNAMIVLADHNSAKPLSIKEISESQQLPEAYLEKLFAPLKKAGLVTAIRGAQGGYSLSRAPAQISVGEVVRALEGSVAPTNCLDTSRPACTHSGACRGRIIWEKVYRSVTGVLDSMTLEDILTEHNTKDGIA